MPAYRSPAEGEIRDAVVNQARRWRPGARILHEVNILDGRNRVDLMLVDRSELTLVEIKSERDKLDRLSDQVNAMRRCAHHTAVALHRKFMPPVEDTRAPRIEGLHHDVLHWWYPTAQDMAEAHHPAFTWREPDLSSSLQIPLPNDALGILWRDELLDLCHALAVPVGKRPNMRELIASLRWQRSAGIITKGICWALRRRESLEADAAIDEPAPRLSAAHEGAGK